MQELKDDLKFVKESLRVLEQTVVAYRAELTDTRREIASYSESVRNLNIDEIVQRVSMQIMAEFYKEVGKAVVKRVLTMIGIAGFFFGCWLIGTGRWKIQ